MEQSIIHLAKLVRPTDRFDRVETQAGGPVLGLQVHRVGPVRHVGRHPALELDLELLPCLVLVVVDADPFVPLDPEPRTEREVMDRSIQWWTTAQGSWQP